MAQWLQVHVTLFQIHPLNSVAPRHVSRSVFYQAQFSLDLKVEMKHNLVMEIVMNPVGLPTLKSNYLCSTL